MQPQGLIGQLNQSMSQGVPALGQVSSTSPNFDPSLQAQPPMPNPTSSTGAGISPALQRAMAKGGQQQSQQPQQPQSVTLPVQDQNPQQPGVQVPATEAELLIKALSSRLGLIGKHESAIRDHMLGTQA